MRLKEDFLKRSASKIHLKIFEESLKETHYTKNIFDYLIENELPTTIRLLELKTRQLESQKTQIDRNFQLEMIERLDHVTLILEDFLNTNKEILSKLDKFGNDYLNLNKDEGEESLIEIQDLPEETIEKLIFDYLEKNKKKKVYPSDIAIAFNQDAKKVFDICQKLKAEGKLV